MKILIWRFKADLSKLCLFFKEKKPARKTGWDATSPKVLRTPLESPFENH